MHTINLNNKNGILKPMKCTKNKDISMVSLTVIGRDMYEFGQDVVK